MIQNGENKVKAIIQGRFRDLNQGPFLIPVLVYLFHLSKQLMKPMYAFKKKKEKERKKEREREREREREIKERIKRKRKKKERSQTGIFTTGNI